MKNESPLYEKKINLPKFKNEDGERDLWANIDLSAYFEPEDFVPVSFPNLKPTSSHITRLMLPGLRKAQEAAIINVVSKSGVTAQEGQSVYSASKWGMKGFTDVLRNDLKKTKIRVGAVYQSGTNTKMFEKAGESFATDNFTDPNDLADVVVFMLSRPQRIWLPEVHVQF